MLSWTRHPGPTCRFVVTPNLDHVVMFQHHAGLRTAYEHASLVLADGMPVVAAARLLRRPLKQRVAGSDLVPALLSRANRVGGLRVFLLGAGPGVAERAGRNITSRWRQITVVGHDCPPLGFEHDPRENERILAAIDRARPDLLILGLGAPKQELWVDAHRERIRASVARVRGRFDRLSRRRKAKSAALDARGGPRMAAPSGKRTAPIGQPLCPRRLDAAQPDVARTRERVAALAALASIGRSRLQCGDAPTERRCCRGRSPEPGFSWALWRHGRVDSGVRRAGGRVVCVRHRLGGRFAA